MARVTSRRLAKESAQDMDIPLPVAQEVVRTFIYKCLRSLVDGDEVVIEGLGILRAKKEKQLSTVTAKDGKKYNTSARVRVSFRRSPLLGRMLRKRMLTLKERGLTKEK